MLEWKTGKGTLMLVCGLGDVAKEADGIEGIWFADCGRDCRDMAHDLPCGSEVLIGEGVGDVAPLNLAAAIKHDRGDVRVLVAASSRGGSMASRASSAGVELLISPAEARECVRSRGTMTDFRSQCVAGRDARSMTACFVSGRGGVGKSTLSVLFALAAHSAGLRTALIDMDTQFGDLAYLCADDGLFEKIPLEEMSAFADFEGIDDGSIPLFHLKTLPEHAESADFRFGRFLLDAKSLYDAIFINTGTHWTDLHADIIGASDLAAFVMDQRPASVVTCREAMDLATRFGTPSSKFTFLLNRCDAREQIGGYDCALALGVDDVLQVFDGGQEVEDAFALGTPTSLLGSRNPAVESATVAACELMKRFGFSVDVPRVDVGFRVLWRRGGKARRGE